MHYLYFDVETGEIQSSSNELKSDANYIEINSELHAMFAKAERKFSDYLIVPSADETEKYALTEKHKTALEFDVDKSIHQFPKVLQNEKENVFVITQKNKSWSARTSLTSQYLKFLTQNENYVNSIKKIYITEENNPNILLDVLELPIKSVLFGDVYVFDTFNKSIAERSDMSLYCGTTFENFVHEVEVLDE